jgi:signal transduction histidine kinase
MENGGTLTVETSSLQQPAEVVVRVSDTGCGIPEKNLPYLFEPFFTTKRVGKGTGLGLAIVHGIVTRAGGRVEVKTAPRKGTTFTIHLPAAVAEYQGEASVQVAGVRTGEPAHRG